MHLRAIQHIMMLLTHARSLMSNHYNYGIAYRELIQKICNREDSSLFFYFCKVRQFIYIKICHKQFPYYAITPYMLYKKL